MNYYYGGAEILAPFSITSNEPMFDVDTVSLKKQRASQEVQRWELSFSTLNSGDPSESLLDTLVGFDDAKTMVMPQFKEVFDSTTCSANPEVLSNVSSGETTVTLDRTTAAGVIPKGSFIKFSNHTKIYILATTANLDSATNPVVTIYPSLVNDVPAEATMNILSDCIISYYRDVTDVRGLTFTDGRLSNLGTINLVEAL